MDAEDTRLGPNGGLVFCMQHLADNLEWLDEAIGDIDGDYILFDCPGAYVCVRAFTSLMIRRPD
jgi:hypothetical protein